MGTVFAVSIVDDIDQAAIDDVFEWWRSVERRFSTFLDDSEINTLASGRMHLDNAHPDVRHVLAVCAELEVATGGRFTIHPPDEPGLLDPAAYVKGWSVDEAALRLGAEGAENFAIYAGGDVRCSGRPVDAESWTVGLKHPDLPKSVVAGLRLSDRSMATSGTYERGDHIWGVALGTRSLSSASVIGPSLGTADALATAIYADQAVSMEWMAAFDEYAVVLVTTDGEIRWSPSLAGDIDVADSTPPGDE